MYRVILHLDMDAFFASVEERDRPRLQGMPIVVGADPKGGSGRGVVSTANYVARKYGIRSALPISTAWRLSEEAAKKGLPRAVFLEPDFKKYSAASGAIMDYLRTLGMVEQASVDEAYIEMLGVRSEKLDRWGNAVRIAREIKEHIKETQGLTCSIGIGPNKLIAKIAAGRNKPDGLTVVKKEEVQAFLDPLSVREIPGIGPKSGETLLNHGVRTIGELRKFSPEQITEMFRQMPPRPESGRASPRKIWAGGEEMWRKAQGIDESPVEEERETKSIGEQETYEQDTLDIVFLTGRIKALSESVFKSAAEEGVRFRAVSITVRFHDFETKTRAHTFGSPLRDKKILETTALQLFLPFLDQRENPRKKKIRLLGVRVEKLEMRQAT